MCLLYEVNLHCPKRRGQWFKSRGPCKGLNLKIKAPRIFVWSQTTSSWSATNTSTSSSARDGPNRKDQIRHALSEKPWSNLYGDYCDELKPPSWVPVGVGNISHTPKLKHNTRIHRNPNKCQTPDNVRFKTTDLHWAEKKKMCLYTEGHTLCKDFTSIIRFLTSVNFKNYI